MLSIFIVDDEIDVIEWLKIYLESMGNTVIGTGYISEAFDILDQNDIDLIITDIAMPEMDGFKFVSKVKDRYKIAPEIVLMTGFGYNPENRLCKIYKESPYPVIFKPFNRYKLNEILDKVYNTKNKLKFGATHYTIEQKPTLIQDTNCISVNGRINSDEIVFVFQEIKNSIEYKKKKIILNLCNAEINFTTLYHKCIDSLDDNSFADTQILFILNINDYNLYFSKIELRKNIKMFKNIETCLDYCMCGHN